MATFVGDAVDVGDSCDEPVLDLMARCIADKPYVGELHDMMKLIKGLRRRGYVLVKLDPPPLGERKRYSKRYYDQG
jgi:hypothetical protein